MVGNGNRVVAGAAFASGGRLTVESRGVRQELSFDKATGDTIVANRTASDVTEGTRITIEFGPAIPRDMSASIWGDIAIQLAGQASSPMLTHPDWYSEAAFDELREAARGTAQELASLFNIDLCHAHGKACEQDQSTETHRDIRPDGPASSLTLDLLKDLAPKAPKLVPIAEDAFSGAYKAETMTALVAGATVPAIVQVWASKSERRNNGADVSLLVNRTPAVAEISIITGGEAYMRGCGMDWKSIGSVPKGGYSVTLAVTTPSIALISDGKTPDLLPFRDSIVSSVGTALRRSHRPKTRGLSIKDAAFEIMEEAYLKASAKGTLPANARQIMYAARPYILERTGQIKLNDAYFTQTLLPAFMDDCPDLTAKWDVVYDARGHLVEPHTDHSLALGTIHVREYLQRRPRQGAGALISTSADLHPTIGPGDRYGAVLFLEKEGFEPLLRAARISERFDVAVMSTKGMSVIAARALIDRLSSAGIKILVAHDLDMAGIRIFGTLGSDSSRYQFSHRPDVRRLGLTLDQAVSMNLQSERQEVQGDHARILEGLRNHGASEGELKFIASGQRVELNAMPSDQFVEWIETSLRANNVQKVIPSAATVEQQARHILGLRHLKRSVSDLEQEARNHAAKVQLPSDLDSRMRLVFEKNPTLPWEDALRVALEGVA